MPIVDGSYVAPTWVNDNPPAMDAAEMQALTDTVEANQNDKAPLASPAFTGTPTAPTAAPGDDSTQIANTEFVQKITLAAFPTDTASGSVASFPDGADNVPVKAMTVDIDYDANGWTGMKLTGTGKNLMGGLTLANLIKAKYGGTIDTGAKTISGFGTGGQDYLGLLSSLVTNVSPVWYPFKPNTQYTLIGKFDKSGTGTLPFGVHYTDNTGRQFNTTSDSDILDADGYRVYVTDSGKTVESVYAGANSQTANNTLWYDTFGVFEGVLTRAEAVAYMQSVSANIDWSGTAGTIYGGTFDPLTGVLTSTLDENGDPLDTPVVTQLDPLTVKSVPGYNVMWADTGDVSVTYRADVGLYVQKLLGN